MSLSVPDTLAPSESSIPQELHALLVSVRRHLHMNPEIGMQEYETARFVREVLEMHGLTVQGPLAGTGLYVDIVGAHDGPTVAYRADIDALQSQDAKSTPWASQRPGCAHLCGHDAHTAVAIGVALLANRCRADLHGTVRVFFQPNEEGIPSGAPQMIRDGVLEGVEAVYAIHVDPTLPVGQFGLTAGPLTAAADRFSVFVRAETSGHSARPHQTVDTVWVATNIAQAFYQLVGRITDARNATVLTICRFRGGEAFNVIPQETEFGGTLRCTMNEDRALLRAHLLRTADHVGALYNADVEVRFEDGSPAVFNDARLIENARTTIRELYAPEAIFEIPRPSMGGEDFSHYLQHVPGAMIRVGTASGPDTSHALHDAMFDLDEAALAPASQLMTHVLMNHLAETVLGEPAH